MSKKTIVLTTYGKDEVLTDISITLFDDDGDYRSNQNAVSYCQNINSLKLQDGEWMNAMVIGQNKKVRLKKPEKIDFDIIKKFNEKQLQILFHEHINVSTIVLALKDGTINDTLMAEWLIHRPSETTNFGSYYVDEFLKNWDKIQSVGAEEIKTAQLVVTEAINRLILAGKIVIDNQ